MASNSASTLPTKATSSTALTDVNKPKWREVLGLGTEFLVPKPSEPTPPIAKKAQKDVTKLAPGFTKPALFQHKNVEFRSSLSERGGGRGFFATDVIYPGELVLAEIPCAAIPDHPNDKDPAERCVLHLVSGKVPLEEAQDALNNIAVLHPRSIDDIDKDRLEGLKRDYEPLVKEMEDSPLGKVLGLTDESTLIRVLCALHFNGFATGVYLHLAMANHSCSPNCVKWGARDGVDHSEVRAMRFITKGEEITFSYLVPSTRSREARQRALQGQFQFICRCELCELDNSESNPYNVLEKGPAEAIHALESLMEELEKQDHLYMDPIGTLRICSKARNEAKMKGVHPRSLSLAHADMVTIDACLALLDDAVPVNDDRKIDDQFLVMTMMTRSISLRKTQRLMFQVGVPQSVSREGYRETRADAEVTLQHILNGIGFFRSMGKVGEKILLNMKDDEDDQKFLFIGIKDADECQLMCDKTARAIADLYEEHSDLIPNHVNDSKDSSRSKSEEDKTSNQKAKNPKV